jgi:hypothetical protein
MAIFKVCVVGGWCGNRMVMVAEYLAEWLTQGGYDCRVVQHSVWNNVSAPPPTQLVLQLLPAYTEAEAGCPVINIRPLLRDLSDPATLERIRQHLQAHYPASGAGRRTARAEVSQAASP